MTNPPSDILESLGEDELVPTLFWLVNELRRGKCPPDAAYIVFKAAEALQSPPVEQDKGVGADPAFVGFADGAASVSTKGFNRGEGAITEGVKAVKLWIASRHNDEPFLANIYDHELRSMVEAVLSSSRAK